MPLTPQHIRRRGRTSAPKAGELPAADKPMELEEGEIKIPALGINEPKCQVLHSQGIPFNFWWAATEEYALVFRGLDIGIPL